jgi:hypothetical protein
LIGSYHLALCRPNDGVNGKRWTQLYPKLEKMALILQCGHLQQDLLVELDLICDFLALSLGAQRNINKHKQSFCAARIFGT